MADDTGEVTSAIQQTDTVSSAAMAIESLMSNPTWNEEREPEPEESAPEDEAPRLGAPDDEQPREEAKPEAPAAPEPKAIEAKEAPAPAPQASEDTAKAKGEWEAKAREAEAARNQFLNAYNTLNAVVPQLQARVQASFPDIKTQQDVLNLMRTDPGRYNDYAIAQAELTFAAQAQQRAQQQLQQEQRTQFETYQQGELKKLPDLIPELADPEKAPAFASKLQDFAKKLGYSPQQLAMASAQDFKVLARAMRADELEANQQAQAEQHEKALQNAKDKAKNAPQVQKPGTSQPQGDTKRIQMREGFKRLQRTGRVDDAANIFRQMLGNS